MAHPLLLLFMKTPVPGRVKTRLIPSLSPESAASLYIALARSTLEEARRVPELQLFIALDHPYPEPPDLSWLSPEPPPFFLQKGEGLGERLLHAFSFAFGVGRGKPVIAIGSDCPAFSGTHLEESLFWLERCDGVLGPACDGGYYLIGLNAPYPQLFTRIPWSTSFVFRETLKRFVSLKLRVALLERLRDLDTFEDYLALRGLLPSTLPPLPSFPGRG